MSRPVQKHVQVLMLITKYDEVSLSTLSSIDRWQVARKTFVDNVCRQVIERHLLRPLSTLFPPEMVAGYSDADSTRIAPGSPQTLAKRKHLRGLYGA